MTDQRYHQIMNYMRHMALDTALRWCESTACACLGCANRNGRLESRGVSKSEWQEWWKRTLREVADEGVR